jgi:hypothetical protein
MKKSWKEIEGSKVRIDVGSTLQQALSDSMTADIICFTTDNHIVFNGEVFTSDGSANGFYVDKGIFNLTEDSSEDEISAVIDEVKLSQIVKAITDGKNLFTDRGNVEATLNKSSKLNITQLALESPDARVSFTKIGDKLKLTSVRRSKIKRIEVLEENATNANVQKTDDSSFSVCDSDGNVALRYSDEGLDAAKVTTHLAELIGQIIGGSISLLEQKEVEENGLYFVDADMNVVASIDDKGLHSINIIEYIND